MSGLFSALRTAHPVRCGDIIDGKRVVQTCYRYENGKHAAIFYLDGDPHPHAIGEPFPSPLNCNDPIGP